MKDKVDTCNDNEKYRKEVERASNYYYFTPQQQGIDNRMKLFVIEACEPFIKGDAVLELGYIDGIWTDVVLNKGFNIDIVEGASRHIRHAAGRYGSNPRVGIFHALFQEFKPVKKYDTVLAADIIRYLPDPVAFLKEISAWLKADGNLIITVPNNRSLHKRAGVLMGVESIPSVQNTRDLEVGNIQSYDKYSLRHLTLQAGYSIEAIHGCFLKPLTSMQMNNWSDEMLRAFYEIGMELEDYCWFIYAICKVRKCIKR